MKLKYSVLITSICFISAVDTALAANVMVPTSHSIELVQQTFPGRQIDVVGITLGMPADEVKSLLQKKYPTVNLDVANGTMNISYKGVNAELESFESAYRVSTDDDTVNITMSTPITGSKVIEIHRDISYRDPLSAPEMNAVADALIQKYGKPSGDGLPQKELRNDSRVMTWLISEKGQFSCPMGRGNKPECDDRKARKAGSTVLIKVFLWYHEGGTKLKNYTLQMMDYVNTDIDSNAADAALKAAIDKSLSATKPEKINL